MISFSKPIRISTTGSTRATSYTWSNKIATRDGKTHVVWLDAIATVCGRTYDHGSGTWGDTVRIEEGCDNHACPSITIDQAGHIRLTYGPHGWNGQWNQARVKWRRSARPGRLDAWEPEGEAYKTSWSNFGYNATAASIVHTPAGLDAVVCRGGEHPPQTMFHRQRESGGWTSAKPLFYQDVEPQYTHNYGHIACASDGTLYAACHFYNIGGSENHPVTGSRSRMRSYGAAILKSRDLGETWTDLAGQVVHTPTLYTHQIAIPPLDENIYVYSITIDSSGTVWAITLNPGLETDGIWLSWGSGKGWQTIRLESYLPANWVAVECMMTIDTRDGLHIALTAVDSRAVGDASHWGHPSSEIFYMFSADTGSTFSCVQVSPTDPEIANWLPSISRPGPFHPVDSPTLLYTHGEVGSGLTPETKTEVWCLSC
ncbi:MAG: hypothetical protein O3B73_00710 [bacterium]|nr:hypothetical protein [bacterium]